MRFFIWGTGNIASKYLAQDEIETDSIIGFIENEKRKDIFKIKFVLLINSLEWE